jgi:uncharacterized protein (TIGR03435 family)
MIPTALAPLASHLWQSTVFAAIAGLLTLALRRNQARVRFWLWLAASYKFLLPFALLVSLGHLFHWRAAPAIMPSAFSTVPSAFSTVTDVISGPAFLTALPAAKPVPDQVPVLLFVICGVWACGFVIVAAGWVRQWLRIRAIARAGSPLRLDLPIRVVSSSARLEPGVFGIFRPVFLLPDGILDRLTQAELGSIIAHELCHVRRRDNLTAAIHMLVEALFWFHPLVWWLGTRLVDERERACDEEVLQAGSQAQAYAESILKVCKFYIESPLTCISGVTGSDLKKRMERIMRNHFGVALSARKKILLVVAGGLALAVPVVAGVVATSRLSQVPARLTPPTSSAPPTFDAASTKPGATQKAGGEGGSRSGSEYSRDSVTVRNAEPSAQSAGQAPSAQPPVAPSPAAQSATTPAPAQDLTGTWQGALHVSANNKDLRTVIKISRANDGTLRGLFYSIDQEPRPFTVGTITVQAVTVEMTIPALAGTYNGTLSADKNSIEGTMTQGRVSLPLNLTRATEETAWAIPQPPPDLKPMAADADPSFEVASIKPSKPGAQGRGFHEEGRQITTVNTSLNDLIQWAYLVHPRQVSGGPAWMETERYDILAEPHEEGHPNLQQWKSMMQKMLADRFQLVFHSEKQELAVYALVVAKGGPKLTPNPTDPNGIPGMGNGFGLVSGRNANMGDFAGAMERNVLDRPVVDQTGLSGRFDFSLRFTPDDSQYTNFPAARPTLPDDPNAPPDLFTAIQEQLGLMLESKKAPVDVLVIDHADHPSPN